MNRKTLFAGEAKLSPLATTLTLLGGAALLLLPANAPAVGLRLPNQDPEGIARGNAFVATADNPSALYYNPAGITQLPGTQTQLGIYSISAHTIYSSPIFGKTHTDADFQQVPQVYVTHSFEDYPISIGLGIYAPYGLGMEWAKPPFAAIAQKGKLIYSTFNPVIAWKVLPTLSVAAGPTLNYADAKFSNASFNFHGNDFTPGFTLGVLWQPVEQLSFGAKYHYETDMDLTGHSDFPFAPGTRAATHGMAHFPQFASFGVSYRPTTNWNFEVDLDWTDWASLNTVTFKRSDGINVPFPFNYQTSWMYEFGVTRQLGNGWYVSVGYIYSENSSPDADYNPIVPDGNLHLGSVGVGHRGKHIDWALGYHFAYGERTVTGATIPLADGHYRTFNNAINISATYKF